MTTPAPPTNLVDLAKLAGVSASTASRALADNPVVGAGTRARIVALAREHGFRVNEAGRNLRLGRASAVAVALPLGHETGQHVSDPFFMSMLGSLADGLADRGHDLLLTRIIPTDDRWLGRLADSGRVAGVLVIGQSDQAAVLDAVAGRYAPLVVWGQAMEGAASVAMAPELVVRGSA